MNAMPDAMLAYAASAVSARGVALVVLALLSAGYAAARARSRIAAWALAMAAVLTTIHIVDQESAGARMVAIVVTLLLAMKAIVASHGVTSLTFRQWAAFTLWPGMRPSIFATLGSPAREGARKLARDGAISFGAGALLLLVARMLTIALSPAAARICATPLLLVGLSLMLHFGLLNLLAAWWRTRGVAAERLFRDPLHAKSLAEFWSRRWNLAFTEMTAVAIHRPIRILAGPRVAIFASFLASGLMHELAISVPARGGYGLPTLYFALHGILVLRDTRSRLVMFLALIAPILLVFHLPFLRTVIWPLAGIR
jgi:alginate O-acetyltransferase complex protein AlgI